MNPVVVAVGLVVLTTNILLPTLVGVYVDAFGLTVREAGYSAAIYMVGGGLGAALVGWGMLRFRTRVFLTAALSALVIGNLASIFAHSLDSILAVRLLAGLGEGAGFALMGAGVSRMKNPNRVYGVFEILLLIIATGIQYTIPWLRDTFGPTMLFVPIAAAPACLLPLVGKFPDLTRRVESVAQAEVPVPDRAGLYLCGVLATLAAYVAYGASFAYIERIGVWVGVPSDAVAKMLGTGYFIGIGGAVLAIITAKRRMRAWGVIVALVVVMLATLLTVQSTPLAYRVGVPILYFSWFYFAPNLLGLLSLADTSGRLAAISTGAQEWGIGLGPAIVAPWIGKGNVSSVALIGAVGYLFAACLLLPVLRQVRRTNVH